MTYTDKAAIVAIFLDAVLAVLAGLVCLYAIEAIHLHSNRSGRRRVPVMLIRALLLAFGAVGANALLCMGALLDISNSPVIDYGRHDMRAIALALRDYCWYLGVTFFAIGVLKMFGAKRA